MDNSLQYHIFIYIYMHCFNASCTKVFGKHTFHEGGRDSKMQVLVQATTFRPLLWCTNAVDEN